MEVTTAECRTVVTGLGAVTPNGLGADAYWSAILEGRSAIAPFSRWEPERYPVRVGGEIRDFAVREHVPGRLRPQTDRVTQYAIAASDWALADAGVTVSDFDEFDVGVITANGCGGFEFGQKELQKLWGTGPHLVSAYQSFAWFYAVNTGQISIHHGIKGHSSVVVTEQAGGLDALAHARRLIANDTLKVALCGGLDAPLCPWGMAAQIPNGYMSEVADEARAYRPFDRQAAGYVPAEGGALLTLEDHDEARARGVERIYGQIAGYAATFDPHPRTGRPSTLPAAIRGALADAGLAPDEVDVVVADAIGAPDLDAAEATAIAEVFGPGGVPVAVPKALTGRLYSGGAPLDTVAALLMIRDGVIPAIPQPVDIPDAYGLDLVAGQPRETPIRCALVIARGLGGFNSALVVRAV
ncbi:ketosynthase chain-length factor [Streptomyces sp. 2A115]|uniref:ketosynthase chain-length factor n=1 Tax=Streptomyces sp. 2A115 TaxID=3457439 RepID=UPI003FD30DAF